MRHNAPYCTQVLICGTQVSFSGRNSGFQAVSPGAAWQRERKRAAPAEFALYPDSALVRRNDAARDRQAQSGALGTNRTPAADLPKLVEDARLVLQRNATAGVGDRHLRFLRLGAVPRRDR